VGGAKDATRLEALTVRATGPATTNGRLALNELARIASALQTTLERIGFSILTGRPHRSGRLPRQVAESVRLDFVGFSEGSAVLTMERGPTADTSDDLLSDAFAALTQGLAHISDDSEELPLHFTSPVVNGLVMLCGGISSENVHRISFESGDRVWFSLDSDIRRRLKAVQKLTSEQEITIVGRLHMGDFDPMGLRCRIDTNFASIPCDLDDDMKNVVFDLLDELVMATGAAEFQADGTTVRVLHLSELSKVESARFQSLDALAKDQGVSSMGDLSALRGEPIDDFDEFLRSIRSAR